MCVCLCVFQSEKEGKGQRALTSDGKNVVSDLCEDLDASSPFCVIRSTHAWDVGNTSFVDVHHTV